MSKTQRKKRERLGLNPKKVTFNLLYKMQSHLFAQSQKINKLDLSELEKRTQLNEILEFMQLISNRLVKRGALTKHQYEN